MKKSEFKIVINASKEKTWDVLFNQYGDIHVHNPNMIASGYRHNATSGELNCVRYCQFNEKMSLEEKITAVDELKSVKMEVTKHNMPMIKEMGATYELSEIGNGQTEVKMTTFLETSPRFMIYLMKGQLNKSLHKHLFGMKYYTETGKLVTKENYASVFKSYK